jgi:hypothetical protein
LTSAHSRLFLALLSDAEGSSVPQTGMHCCDILQVLLSSISRREINF